MIDLTEGNEYKTILIFSLPILLSNVFQQLYNIADSIIVGRMLGEKELAAVGASASLYSILLAIALGITLGISILVSNFYGSKEHERVKKAIETGLIISFVLTLIVTVIGVVFSMQIIRLFNVPQEIEQSANIYVKIIFAGAIGTFGYNVYSNILRGLGDTKSSLYILIASSVLNLILAVTFITVFKLGVGGVAFATVLSQLFSLVVIYVYTYKKYECYRIDFRKISLDVSILKKSLEIGIPSMLQQLFVSLGWVVLQRLINGYGYICIAAFTGASRIDAFATMPALNLGKALSNFVAQNIGAKKVERIKRGYRGSLLMGALISVAISLLVITCGRYFMYMFNNNPEVISAGVNYFRIIGSFYLVFSIMQIMNGLILGMGKALIPTIATVGSFCLVQIPLAIILSSHFGINGIWIASPIGWVAGMLIRMTYIKLYLKDTIQLSELPVKVYSEG